MLLLCSHRNPGYKRRKGPISDTEFHSSISHIFVHLAYESLGSGR
jgi:hypothetical protein